MLRETVKVDNLTDYTLFFVKNNTNKVEVITAKQAKQKKAMKLLGVWVDAAYWDEMSSRLQVMLLN